MSSVKVNVEHVLQAFILIKKIPRKQLKNQKIENKSAWTVRLANFFGYYFNDKKPQQVKKDTSLSFDKLR